MFPIDDTDVRGAGPGIVTIGLIIVNVVVFLFEISIGAGLRGFIQQYGATPVQILQGNQLHTLLTSIFIHAGWMHLISNMVFLWIFGDNVEAALGRIGYLVFYIGGGLAASATHILTNPAATLPSVGASGAIGAVLGAYIVMFPRSRVKVLLMWGFAILIRRVTAFIFLGIWFIMQLFSGVAALGAQTAQSGGVAFWAHIGGFVFGLLIGFLFRGRAKRLELEREPRRA